MFIGAPEPLSQTLFSLIFIFVNARRCCHVIYGKKIRSLKLEFVIRATVHWQQSY